MPRALKNIYSRQQQKRVLPRSCSLFMTTYCNFKCKGCRRELDEEFKLKEMNLETVQQLISVYPSIKYFVLAGYGEPSFCRNFSDVVEFLIEKKKYFGIITNGSNIKPIISLSRIPTSVSFSLYGYDRDSYLDHTGSDAFGNVVKNFTNLKLNNYNVGFSFILNRENYFQLGKIMDLCDKLQPNFLHLHNYLPYSTDEERISKIITTDDIHILSYIDEVSNNRDYYIHKLVPIDLQNPTHHCCSHNYVINLDPDGNIGGCMRQVPPDNKYGNIWNCDDPFRNGEMKKIQQKVRKKEDAFELCKYCFGNYN